MRIAIVDICRPDRIRPEELAAAVRAINRQVDQDFAPHWSIVGELRVEAAHGTAPSSRDHGDPRVRADGVIYLADGPADVEKALGYHALTNDGLPFGHVFLDVCESLAEPWTVTLSHEVLEMLADPDVNLLCRGPHPNRAENGRIVYHWFEVCDAVQAQRYAIDGIEVSNFVLPLYFTGGEERMGRNDFLGTRNPSGRTLLSFDVNRGGYVGFFDPETGRSDTFHVPSDANAAKRQRIKKQMLGDQAARRTERRGVVTPLSVADGEVGGAVLEALVFHLEPGSDDPDRVAATVAMNLLGPAFAVERARWEKDASAIRYVARPSERVAVGDGFEAARRLAASPHVARVEPSFESSFPEEAAAEARVRMHRTGLFGDDHLPASAPCEWSVNLVNAPAAWAQLPPGTCPGDGIYVGHPDTGYTDHPEIAGKVESRLGYDFLRDDADAHDDLDRMALIPNPGHGTGTASVIVSDRGPPGSAGQYVTGVAPGARIAPLRISRSVVQVSQERLTRAIHRAVDLGCHVISMSVGGLPSGELHDAVRRAVDSGVIVCAAAGNHVGFVVWPAAYDEVIAVAACNADRVPWSGSSRGRAVDITAPGESVWRARPRLGSSGEAWPVDRGSGTSFAVASVAGIAALWLQRHGVAQLRVNFPGSGLQALFKSLLMSTAQSTAGWDTGTLGAGIADADALLRAALPALPPALPVMAGRAPDDVLAHVFPEANAAAVTAAVAEVVDGNAGPDEAELVVRFATQPELRRSMQRVIQTPSSSVVRTVLDAPAPPTGIRTAASPVEADSAADERGRALRGVRAQLRAGGSHRLRKRIHE